jgi:hypothetical protein
VSAIVRVCCGACTEGSRQLILCLVRSHDHAHVIRALIAALLLCACSTPPRTVPLQFEAGTIVASGYRHYPPERQRDTPTASGAFENRVAGFRIEYAAFTYGRSFADPAFLRQRGDTVVWTRTSGAGLRRHISTLYEDRFGNRTFCVSFPSAGPTNFLVESPTPEQIQELERIVSTFVPAMRNET